MKLETILYFLVLIACSVSFVVTISVILDSQKPAQYISHSNPIVYSDTDINYYIIEVSVEFSKPPRDIRVYLDDNTFHTEKDYEQIENSIVVYIKVSRLHISKIKDIVLKLNWDRGRKIINLTRINLPIQSLTQ